MALNHDVNHGDDDLYIIGAVSIMSQKSLYRPDDPSRPCRPKAGQGLVMIMMMMMMMKMVMMVKMMMIMMMILTMMMIMKRKELQRAQLAAV